MSMAARGGTHWISPPDPMYPETDGEPMAEGTTQYRWIVTIKGGLEVVFRDRPDVFVAGDHFWYPVEGAPGIRVAPDVMVVIGRPKGERGCYKQWEEGGIAPQVVFEVLSPGNRAGEMERKLRFFEQYGAEEYYKYDPERHLLAGYLRDGDRLAPIAEMEGWISPLLGIRFVMSDGELSILDPAGRPLQTYEDLALERDEAIAELDEVVAARDEVIAEREAQRRRAERMAEKLRALGIDPDA